MNQILSTDQIMDELWISLIDNRKSTNINSDFISFSDSIEWE